MQIEPNRAPSVPISAEAIWHTPPAAPTLWVRMRRGAADRCPMCGCKPLFQGYLRLTPVCRQCYTELGAVRADDMPPYFTIMLLGHIIVPLLLMVEVTYTPPLWLEAAIFLPLTVILAVALLRPIKGATVGWLLHHQFAELHQADPHHAGH